MVLKLINVGHHIVEENKPSALQQKSTCLTSGCKPATPEFTHMTGWKISIFLIGDTSSNGCFSIVNCHVSFPGSSRNDISKQICPCLSCLRLCSS